MDSPVPLHIFTNWLDPKIIEGGELHYPSCICFNWLPNPQNTPSSIVTSEEQCIVANRLLWRLVACRLTHLSPFKVHTWNICWSYIICACGCNWKKSLSILFLHSVKIGVQTLMDCMLKCIWVPLENLVNWKVVKKFYAFDGTPQDRHHLHNSPLFALTVSQMKPFLTLSSQFLKIRFIIILPSAPTSSKQLFPPKPRLKNMNEFLVFIHPTCPVNLIIVDLITLLIFREYKSWGWGRYLGLRGAR